MKEKKKPVEEQQKALQFFKMYVKENNFPNPFF